jgi:hypothetical protein
MSAPRLQLAKAKRIVHAVEKALRAGYPPPGHPVPRGHFGAKRKAAEALDIPDTTFSNALRIAARAYREPDWSLFKAPPPPPEVKIAPPAPAQAARQEVPLPDRLLAALRRGPANVRSLAATMRAEEKAVLSALTCMVADGFNLRSSEDGRTWRLNNAVPPSYLDGPLQALTMKPDHTITIGAVGDAHLGSKYERLDVLNSLYDVFAEAGVEVVLNTGNWIDGEARFNTHDLHTHGMDGQLAYLAAHYPKRHGMATWAVAGNDHEGWYGQREGVDIARYAHRVMQDHGRTDWVNLGFMEAPIRLVNSASGKDAIAAVVHPGGGSAYALSYSIQKIIESLDGGEKPAVGFYGHYHKLWAGNIRNVWCVQTGCTQDQTPFMRQRKLEAHVGGTLVKLTQDPATGAIVRCQVELLRYFVRGYYTDRWSHGRGVQLPRRSAA